MTLSRMALRAIALMSGALLLALCSVLHAGTAASSNLQPLPSDSVYNAAVNLIDQDGQAVAFAGHRGRAMLVSMFYTSCPYACPVTIEALRNTRDQLPPDIGHDLPVLLISFDTLHDTPERLKAAAKAHDVDDRHWTLARAPADDVRTLAALLGIRYRALPDGGFNHSTVLILLDSDGRIAARTERLASTDPEFLAAIRATVARH